MNIPLKHNKTVSNKILSDSFLKHLCDMHIITQGCAMQCVMRKLMFDLTNSKIVFIFL